MGQKCDVRWPREILKCCFQLCTVLLRLSLCKATTRKLIRYISQNALEGEVKKKRGHSDNQNSSDIVQCKILLGELLE